MVKLKIKKNFKFLSFWGYIKNLIDLELYRYFY